MSGASHKYKTAKAAEVTRLVQMLGTLGRRMAALPERVEEKRDEVMVDVAADEGGAAAGGSGSGVQTPVGGASASAGAAQGQGQTGGGGGKGKKRKGKR